MLYLEHIEYNILWENSRMCISRENYVSNDEKAAVCKPGREPEKWPVKTPILGIQPPGLWENSHLVCMLSPRRLRQLLRLIHSIFLSLTSIIALFWSSFCLFPDYFFPVFFFGSLSFIVSLNVLFLDVGILLVLLLVMLCPQPASFSVYMSPWSILSDSVI